MTSDDLLKAAEEGPLNHLVTNQCPGTRADGKRGVWFWQSEVTLDIKLLLTAASADIQHGGEVGHFIPSSWHRMSTRPQLLVEQTSSLPQS